jgi:hypothetical protein
MKDILWTLIVFIIQSLKLTCGTCKNRKTIHCGIVCDFCADRHESYALGNKKLYFCFNYQQIKRRK